MVRALGFARIVPPVAFGGATSWARPLARFPGAPPWASASPASDNDPAVASATALATRTVRLLMELLPHARGRFPRAVRTLAASFQVRQPADRKRARLRASCVRRRTLFGQ